MPQYAVTARSKDKTKSETLNVIADSPEQAIERYKMAWGSDSLPIVTAKEAEEIEEPKVLDTTGFIPFGTIDFEIPPAAQFFVDKA